MSEDRSQITALCVIWSKRERTQIIENFTVKKKKKKTAMEFGFGGRHQNEKCIHNDFGNSGLDWRYLTLEPLSQSRTDSFHNLQSIE